MKSRMFSYSDETTEADQSDSQMSSQCILSQEMQSTWSRVSFSSSSIRLCTLDPHYNVYYEEFLHSLLVKAHHKNKPD